MHETTKDKAYFQKFIKQTIKIYNSRSDKLINEKNYKISNNFTATVDVENLDITMDTIRHHRPNMIK